MAANTQAGRATAFVCNAMDASFALDPRQRDCAQSTFMHPFPYFGDGDGRASFW